MESIYSSETSVEIQWTARLLKQLVYGLSEIIKIYFGPITFPSICEILGSHGGKYNFHSYTMKMAAEIVCEALVFAYESIQCRNLQAYVINTEY
jgi:hypothetical protein